jgi:hypothetical protein
VFGPSIFHSNELLEKGVKSVGAKLKQIKPIKTNKILNVFIFFEPYKEYKDI